MQGPDDAMAVYIIAAVSALWQLFEVCTVAADCLCICGNRRESYRVSRSGFGHFRHLSSSFREVPTLRVLLHSLIQLEPTAKFILAIQSVKKQRMMSTLIR